jgi:peptidoglycan/xylan/chitin deacetylase (PgdA/CDA1 family)
MQRSRAELAALLDRPVDGFAYPGGRMNEAVVDAARRVGFRHAVSTVSCINRLPADAWSLGRVGMPDSSLADLKRALHGIARRAG